MMVFRFDEPLPLPVVLFSATMRMLLSGSLPCSTLNAITPLLLKPSMTD